MKLTVGFWKTMKWTKLGTIGVGAPVSFVRPDAAKGFGRNRSRSSTSPGGRRRRKISQRLTTTAPVSSKAQMRLHFRSLWRVFCNDICLEHKSKTPCLEWGSLYAPAICGFKYFNLYQFYYSATIFLWKKLTLVAKRKFPERSCENAEFLGVFLLFFSLFVTMTSCTSYSSFYE